MKKRTKTNEVTPEEKRRLRRVASLDAILRPRSIAVVGVSRKKQSIGRQILHNLLDFGFEGKVFPVNPSAKVVHSMKCYPRVSAIPDRVDLAIVVVPASRVLSVVRDCGRKKVRGLVLITAGFKEIGGRGEKLEEQLTRTVRRLGMRMVGPNCMGVMNTEASVCLNGSFASVDPLAGSVAFVSQSGALGEIIIAQARERNAGISMFVSLGNRADVTANDLLEYWEDNEETGQILMYLESFGNPRDFPRVARRVARKKPIITVKSGRTAQGARAASSHTGSVVGLDFATESLFEQCGVVRARTMQEMLTLAEAFSNQPLPRGDRVAILTNAGGPGILATDTCVQLGLRLAVLEESTRKSLRKVLPPEAAVRNPVDTTASAQPEHFGAALEILKKDRSLDAIIVLFVSPIMIDGFAVARNITGALRKWNRPVMSCFMGKHRLEEGMEELRSHGIPVYLFPEEAARALAAMNQYREYRKRPTGRFVSYPVDRKRAEAVFRKVARDDRSSLTAAEVETVLGAYGFPLAPARIVRSPDDAIDFAGDVGYPIVLKVLSRRFTHKTELGGVQLDLRGPEETTSAFRKLLKTIRRKDPEAEIQAQKMITPGIEVILGVTSDPQFGPLLLFGLGGIHVEVLKDVSVRVHPISDLDAEEMIRSIRGFPLLEGVRGAKGVDLERLRELLVRLSQLVSDFEQIREMDINPFLAAPVGELSAAVDARIFVRPGVATRR